MSKPEFVASGAKNYCAISLRRKHLKNNGLRQFPGVYYRQIIGRGTRVALVKAAAQILARMQARYEPRMKKRVHLRQH